MTGSLYLEPVMIFISSLMSMHGMGNLPGTCIHNSLSIQLYARHGRMRDTVACETQSHARQRGCLIFFVCVHALALPLTCPASFLPLLNEQSQTHGKWLGHW